MEERNSIKWNGSYALSDRVMVVGIQVQLFMMWRSCKALDPQE